MIPMARRNTHRKPKENGTGRKVAAGAVVVGAGLGSAAFATNAQAATMEHWDKIAQCESGGDWSIDHGDGGASIYGGGLQFQPASWHAALDYLHSKGIDTSHFGEWAYNSTKDQQILAAEALLAEQPGHPDPWACDPGQILGPSMFDGGANPWGLPGAQIPASVLAGGSTVLTPPPVSPVKPVVVSSHKRTRNYKHVVVSGDTLYDIAKNNGAGAGVDNWRALYERNKDTIGANPDLIYPGQTLWLTGSHKRTAAHKAPSTALYQRPVPGPITQSYGNPGAYTLGYHTGLDFGAPFGAVVKAATAGTVVESDGSAPYGLNVQILNDDGTYSLYAHLSGKNVSVGQHVAAGAHIGLVGNSGTHSSGPHLHFEIRIHPVFAAGNFVDPADWLREHGVKP